MSYLFQITQITESAAVNSNYSRIEVAPSTVAEEKRLFTELLSTTLPELSGEVNDSVEVREKTSMTTDNLKTRSEENIKDGDKKRSGDTQVVNNGQNEINVELIGNSEPKDGQLSENKASSERDSAINKENSEGNKVNEKMIISEAVTKSIIIEGTKNIVSDQRTNEQREEKSEQSDFKTKKVKSDSSLPVIENEVESLDVISGTFTTQATDEISDFQVITKYTIYE